MLTQAASSVLIGSILATCCLAGSLASQLENKKPLPVVLWHGMGDSCCSSHTIGGLKSHLESMLGVFVYSIATGSGEADDTYSSFFGSVMDQVDNTCESLAQQPELQEGYNGVGFSQGGQFLRAVVERCQHRGPRMHTLVTLGAQHQGIMNVPECWNPSFNLTPSFPCGVMQKILSYGAYLPWVRSHIVQAQYFKDPYHLDDYLAANPFLPEINNERPVKNPLYKDNFLSLERLVLIRFDKDVTVVPMDSAWFSFYNGDRLLTMQETDLYQEDFIGLRQLDEEGKVELKSCPTAHMQFGMDWFDRNVVQRYLANTTGVVASSLLST